MVLLTGLSWAVFSYTCSKLNLGCWGTKEGILLSWLLFKFILLLVLFDWILKIFSNWVVLILLLVLFVLLIKLKLEELLLLLNCALLLEGIFEKISFKSLLIVWVLFVLLFKLLLVLALLLLCLIKENPFLACGLLSFVVLFEDSLLFIKLKPFGWLGFVHWR